MTGRARRRTKQLLREYHAKVQPPVARTTNLPATHEHPACLPLDIDALTESIVLSPSFNPPAAPPPREKPLLQPRPVPPAQQPAVIEVATRLMEALVNRYGREVLNPADVYESVRAAAALVREASR